LPTAPVSRRVVHIDGYYPTAPEAAFARYQRELGRFCRTWGVSAEAAWGDMDGDRSLWRVAVTAPDWSGSIEHLLFRWDDLIVADRSRGWPSRLPLALLAFADFVAGGAFFRYLRHAWRYALFFLYPFLWLFGLMALSLLAWRWGLELAGAPGSVWLWPAALATTALAVPALSHLAFLDHLFDDWIYARRMVRHGDAAVAERLNRLAAELAGHDEEVLIVGHSFGAVHALDLIRAIRRLRPDGPPIRLATVGSSILKVALHGAAAPLRRALAEVAALPNVIWYDFTALNDVMNFHRKEPIATLGLPGRPAQARKVRFRQMVDADFYRKMERNFFRLHSQFISGNDKRARYDYYMMCLGPFALERLADSDEGAIFWLDEAGALTEAGRAALSAPSTGRSPAT